MWKVTSIALACGFLLSGPTFSEPHAPPVLGCLAKLDVEDAVHEALSPRAQTLLTGVGGTWHLDDTERVPEWPEQPWYPHHSVFEFSFRGDIPDLEEDRHTLCDVLASRLETSCDEVVERSDRLLACVFLVRSGEYDGTLDVLPDEVEPSRRALIVVVNEW